MKTNNPFIQFVCLRTENEISLNITRIESFEPYNYPPEEKTFTRVCLFNGGSMVLRVEYEVFSKLIVKWFE